MPECCGMQQNQRAREAEPGTTVSCFAQSAEPLLSGGEGAEKDSNATRKVTKTLVLPLRQVAKLQSWRSVRSMELDEQLLLHVTQTRGSSARQNGTLENSQAFLGNLKSGLEAGVQQERQQSAHFHVHRECLGHPSPKGTVRL